MIVMLIYCFEDERVEKLAPIIHARPAYAITCAGYRLVDWLKSLRTEYENARLVGEIREYLRPLQTSDYGVEDVPSCFESPDAFESEPHDVLLVNARIVPSVSNFRTLREMIGEDRSTVIMSGTDEAESEIEPNTDARRNTSGTVLAAWLPAAEARKALVRAAEKNAAAAADAPATKKTSSSRRPSTATGPAPADTASVALRRHAAMTAARSSVPMTEFDWPHDVVSAHMRCMKDSTEYRIANGAYTQLQDGVFVGNHVTIGEYESIHTGGGPIVLDDNVSVGPFCFLEGPLFAGRNTRVIEHSSIKDGVSLGHTTKIGGEVEASVIEPYTNKQHHGFLGHSYLGSWINLGAGTCNSDLKNTYGKINIQYGEEKIATGMQFLGCIMGDYSKSAINTGIFTGKVIGVCSMMYGFVTGNVPSYVNYARLFGQTSLLPPEVMVNTQARMFARRKVQQRPADIDLIHAMYHRTEIERQQSDQLGF